MTFARLVAIWLILAPPLELVSVKAVPSVEFRVNVCELATPSPKFSVPMLRGAPSR